MTPSFSACAAALLVALSAPAQVATVETHAIGSVALPRLHENIGEADTLVFIDSRVADRDRYNALINQAYPKARVLYTSIDENVDADAISFIRFGTDPDNIRDLRHRTLVIISSFRNASLNYGKLSTDDAAKHWADTFARTQKNRRVRLHLLSTDKDPPMTYLGFVASSGGTYRKLTSGTNGSYE